MNTQIPGTVFREIIFEAEVDSTNSLVMGRAEQGDEEGLVIVADSQRAGKGRHGRIWHSPAGKNVYMSVLLRPHIKTADASILTVLVSVAVCEAIREITGLDIRIKWPNDLVVGKKKLCGILMETRIEKEFIPVAVAGIGINVNMSGDEMPPDIREVATSLAIESGKEFDRNEIVIAGLRAIDHYYSGLRAAGQKTPGLNCEAKAALLQRWRKLDTVIGREISVKTARGIVSGKALEICDNGMLRILTRAGKTEMIHTGDISF